MAVLASLFARRRQRRSQLWMPSTRELWCYAIILTASQARKPSATDVTPTDDAAEPANRSMQCAAQPCYSPERKTSDRLKCRAL
jgi:hypothetical protein